MTPLRQRMIDDMRLAGFAERTRDVYIQAVRRLAAHYLRSPDVLSEEEVRAYLLHLRDERGIARGTFKTNHGGIRFLYSRTLDRDWPLFSQKNAFARRGSSACRPCSPMPRSTPSWLRCAIRSTAHSLTSSAGSRTTICRGMARRCCPRTGVPSPTFSPAERKRSADTSGAAITAAGEIYSYHSCKNRSCPRCHKDQTERWIAAREAELLACPYFHAHGYRAGGAARGAARQPARRLRRAHESDRGGHYRAGPRSAPRRRHRRRDGGVAHLDTAARLPSACTLPRHRWRRIR